jgi:hypothetical protein
VGHVRPGKPGEWKKRRNVPRGTFCTGEIVSTRIYSLGPEDYESQDFSRLKLGRIRDRLIPQSLAVSSGDDDRKEQPGAVDRDGGRHCSSHIGAAVEASVALSVPVPDRANCKGRGQECPRHLAKGERGHYRTGIPL